MRGIYLIRNNINKKCYIGQAENIEERWKQHQSYYNNPKHNFSCPKLYAAFQKYGVENFSFIVVEVLDNGPIDMCEKEEYWINKMNTIHNGYNVVLPTKVFKGEENPKAKLTWEQVHEIKDLLKNSQLSQQDIAKQFNVHFANIYRINRGESWVEPNETYPIRTWNELAHYGETSGRSKLTDAEVMHIRERYVNESVSEIWQDYKELYSLSGFKKLCQGVTYSHLPIYKKTTKTWINK